MAERDVAVPRGLSLAAMKEAAQALMDAGQFSAAEVAFSRLLNILGSWDANRTDISQRLALAAYKSGDPTPFEALQRAIGFLDPLNPETSNDPETLGLVGAIRKRLWEETMDRTHLDGSVRAYERGYHLRHDYLPGINFAFMLDVRASVEPNVEESTTDRVVARRIRREVLVIVDRSLVELRRDTTVRKAETYFGQDGLYWILSVKAEALIGLGDEEGGLGVLAEAEGVARVAWMLEATRRQIARLRTLLSARAP